MDLPSRERALAQRAKVTFRIVARSMGTRIAFSGARCCARRRSAGDA